MKVGIVTQPLYNNYGGLLQNYALQQVLIRLGHDVKTIDFVYRQSFLNYILSVGKQIIRAAIKLQYPQITPYVPIQNFRNPIMGDFVDNYINTTQIVHSYTYSLINKEHFEAVITGSDQVWRPMYNVYIQDMYLKFVPDKIKKIAYAASLGVDTWEYKKALTRICAKLVKRIDAVSVREETGVNLCQKHLGVDATCVLDPTILAGASTYKPLLKEKKGPNYLFAYILDITPAKKEYVEGIAKANNLEIKIHGADKNAILSVEDWLSMIANASFVVTDSFHGTVFSILFHREFYSIVNMQRGGTRFSSLLNPLGLHERLCDVSPINPLRVIPINWNAVESLLEEKRRNSLDFLIKSLE